MNILNKTYCYLGGNLENTNDALGWRALLTQKLEELGVICLDPTRQMFRGQIAETEESRLELKQWRENGEIDKIQPFMKEVVRRDLRAIDISCFTIFRLEPTKPTWGTVHEIVVAVQQRKPVLILIDDIKQFPLWFMGIINMDYVFTNINDLIDYLRKVNSGETPIDDKYWKILDIKINDKYE